MDWLLHHETIVALAVAGAIPSVLISVLQVHGSIGPTGIRILSFVSYVLMTLSMALFIITGYYRTQ